MNKEKATYTINAIKARERRIIKLVCVQRSNKELILPSFCPEITKIVKIGTELIKETIENKVAFKFVKADAQFTTKEGVINESLKNIIQ